MLCACRAARFCLAAKRFFSRRLGRGTAPGPHEIDSNRAVHRPAYHACDCSHADRGRVWAVTRVMPERAEVPYASREMVACDTLKVRATSACASPLASRWRASWR
jgi:hypothetical protein